MNLKYNRLIINKFCILFIIFTIIISTVYSKSQAATTSANEAIRIAQKTGKYLFILCYDSKNSSYSSMVKTVENFQNITKGKINIYKLHKKNKKDANIVTKYGINRTPLPLLLIIAPNGVVTGGFPEKVTKEQLKKNTTISRLILNILKPLQDQKIVLVSLQNKKTKYNRESDRAINDFTSDSSIKSFVKIIKANPTATGSKDFLKQAGLSKKITEAIVVFMIPPGRIVRTFKGKITKNDLLSALQACSSGSGSGCCPK